MLKAAKFMHKRHDQTKNMNETKFDYSSPNGNFGLNVHAPHVEMYYQGELVYQNNRFRPGPMRSENEAAADAIALVSQRLNDFDPKYDQYDGTFDSPEEEKRFWDQHDDEIGLWTYELESDGNVDEALKAGDFESEVPVKEVRDIMGDIYSPSVRVTQNLDRILRKVEKLGRLEVDEEGVDPDVCEEIAKTLMAIRDDRRVIDKGMAKLNRALDHLTRDALDRD